MTVDNFITKARKVHGDKYDYSKVEYVNNQTLVKIVCPVHGEFWQIPYNHCKGKGCPKCGIEERREKRTYWTKEKVLEIAKNFNIRTHFKKAYGGAYKVASKNGWLDEMDWFELKTSWTKELVFEVAKECKSKEEFMAKYAGAYDKAQREGWKEELYSSVGWQIKKVKNFWDRENVFKEARLYHSTSEFRINNETAYNEAKKNHWLEEMVWLEKPKQLPVGYWTKERVYSEASKYTSKRQFEKGCSSAHSVARKKGWLNEIAAKFNYKTAKDELLDFDRSYSIYVYEFVEENTVYVGLTDSKKRRDQQHRTGVYTTAFGEKLNSPNSPVLRFAKENKKEIPTPKYVEDGIVDKSDAQEAEHNWILKYIEDGWNVLNKGKTGRGIGALGSNITKWNKSSVFKESKKYTSRNSFKDHSASAYNVALRNGWLDEMPWLVAKHKSWDKESVFETAKEYRSRKEFEKGNLSAHRFASKMGWLDEMSWFKKKNTKEPRKFNREYVFGISKEFTSRADFSKNARGAYDAARRNGWLDEMTWLIPQSKSWDRESVFEESRKYHSRSEFEKESRSAYDFARHNGWLNDMPWLVSKHKSWNRESVFDESRKYSSISEFGEKASQACKLARKNGWLEDIIKQNGWKRRINQFG